MKIYIYIHIIIESKNIMKKGTKKEQKNETKQNETKTKQHGGIHQSKKRK